MIICDAVLAQFVKFNLDKNWLESWVYSWKLHA